MKYQLQDLFLIDGVEAKVAFINAYGEAYLVPLNEGDYYDFKPIYTGVVFAVLNSQGKEKITGRKGVVINNHKCGAV